MHNYLYLHKHYSYRQDFRLYTESSASCLISLTKFKVICSFYKVENKTDWTVIPALIFSCCILLHTSNFHLKTLSEHLILVSSDKTSHATKQIAKILEMHQYLELLQCQWMKEILITRGGRLPAACRSELAGSHLVSAAVSTELHNHISEVWLMFCGSGKNVIKLASTDKTDPKRSECFEIRSFTCRSCAIFLFFLTKFQHQINSVNTKSAPQNTTGSCCHYCVDANI